MSSSLCGSLLLLALSATAHAQNGVDAIALSSRARARADVRGVVAALRPAENDPGWLTVEVAGQATFDLAAREADLPFRVGDAIDAHLDCTRGGFHYVCSGVIRDGAGALLVAIAGSGEQLAPEWRVLGPVASGAHRDGSEIESGLSFEHAGQRTTTRHDCTWTTVRASDGEWRVSGCDRRFAGRGPRPPDMVDYSQYAISRAPRP